MLFSLSLLFKQIKFHHIAKLHLQCMKSDNINGILILFYFSDIDFPYQACIVLKMSYTFEPSRGKTNNVVSEQV